jgi:hypothetical protein
MRTAMIETTESASIIAEEEEEEISREDVDLFLSLEYLFIYLSRQLY